jgi:hypothetical protein
MKRVPGYRAGRVGTTAIRALMRRTLTKRQEAAGSDCTCSASTLHTLKRVSGRLGISPETLHEALHSMPMGRSVALGRVNRVTRGLERELGGRDILRKWAHTPIMAFGNKKPVDVLVAGHVEPLERLQAVLEAGVYS